MEFEADVVCDPSAEVGNPPEELVVRAVGRVQAIDGAWGRVAHRRDALLGPVGDQPYGWSGEERDEREGEGTRRRATAASAVSSRPPRSVLTSIMFEGTRVAVVVPAFDEEFLIAKTIRGDSGVSSTASSWSTIARGMRRSQGRARRTIRGSRSSSTRRTAASAPRSSRATSAVASSGSTSRA